MATTKTVANPRVSKGHLETTDVYVKNGTSWNAGELLRENSSGLVEVCVTDADAGAGGIQYLALSTQADPGNDTTEAQVGILTTDTELEFNELDGTVGIANIGMQYGIDVSSNVATLDVGDTSNPAFVVTDIGWVREPMLNDSTDIKAIIYAKPLAAVIDAARTTTSL